ncbi:Hypothetical predicted protein, partial [Pelobates cultripes]
PKQPGESLEKPINNLTDQADYTALRDEIFAAFWHKLERRLQTHAEIKHGTHSSQHPRGGYKMATARTLQRTQGQQYRPTQHNRQRTH